MSPPGTSGDRRESRAPDRAGDLAEVVLRDHEGNDVRLGETWQERPAVLVWLRHYG